MPYPLDVLWRLFLIILGILLVGVLIGALVGCCTDGHPHPDRTYRYDRTGHARGYYYPKNNFYRTHLKGPNIDNTRRCPKPLRLDHSKCCRRR